MESFVDSWTASSPNRKRMSPTKNSERNVACPHSFIPPDAFALKVGSDTGLAGLL